MVSVARLRLLAKLSVPAVPAVPGMSVPVVCVTFPTIVPVPVMVLLVTEYPPTRCESNVPAASAIVPLLLIDPPTPSTNVPALMVVVAGVAIGAGQGQRVVAKLVDRDGRASCRCRRACSGEGASTPSRPGGAEPAGRVGDGRASAVESVTDKILRAAAGPAGERAKAIVEVPVLVATCRRAEIPVCRGAAGMSPSRTVVGAIIQEIDRTDEGRVVRSKIGQHRQRGPVLVLGDDDVGGRAAAGRAATQRAVHRHADHGCGRSRAGAAVVVDQRDVALAAEGMT